MMRRAQPWLGTIVDITVRDAAAPARAIDAAFEAIALVHRLMSFHDPDSDVSRLNRAGGGALVEVSPHTATVLRLAEAVGAACDGVFNIACAPQLVQWDCLPAPQPSTPAYRAQLRVLELAGATRVRKLADGWIDLGGIAKGYAVDQAIGALAGAGVRSACVNAGGDLRAIGMEAFEVALRDPARPTMAAVRVAVRGEALATSATYFSKRARAGDEVSAMVDGRDGTPVLSGRSVSVRAASCAVADALTKLVLTTGRADHPALAAFGATALII